MDMDPETVFLNLQEILHSRPLLTKLENYTARCLLLKSSDKLKIIEGVMPGKPASPQLLDYQPLTLKIEDFKFKVLTSFEQTAENYGIIFCVKRTIRFLLELLRKIISEIEYHDSFGYLDYVLCCQNWEHWDKIILKQENKNYNAIITRLQNTIDKCKYNFERTQNFLLETTGSCLDQSLIDVYVQEETAKLQHFTKEQTRIEFNLLQLKCMEDKTQKFLNVQIVDAEENNKIHLDLELHLNTTIRDLQMKLDYWTERYNNEIERLDVDLLQNKSKMEELKQTKEKTLNDYNIKRELVQKMQEESDEEERRLKKKRVMVRAAVIIQLWWRRILVKKGYKVRSDTKLIRRHGKEKAKRKK